MDELREKIQAEAKKAWFDAGCMGTLVMGTGTGKSKVGIDIVYQLSRSHELATFGAEPLKVLLVTSTVILHEKNWRLEFMKFGLEREYERLERTCYVSLPNYEPDDYDLVIFDEYHHISERGFELFSSKIDPAKTKALGLTATPPKRGERREWFEQICPVVYEYSISEAAGVLVNDFRIKVVTLPLDSKTRNVKAGSKDKPFMTTEEASYAYHSKMVAAAKANGDKAGLQWQSLARKRALDNYPSRVVSAKKVIAKELVGFKSIIFAPSIAQAEEVCKNTFHSKVDSSMMENFISGQIDMIAAVTMADEGLTMGKVERALIMKLNSTDKTFVQRIGRVCRNDLDKVSEITVLVYAGTVEENYLEEALSSIDKDKVTYMTISKYDN